MSDKKPAHSAATPRVPRVVVSPETPPKGSKPIRSMKAYHTEVFEPQMAQMKQQLAGISAEIADTKRKADLALSQNPKQDRAIQRAYERLERHSARITDLEARRERVEDRASSGTESSVVRAEGDAAGLSTDIDTAYGEVSEDIRRIESKFDAEVKRLDDRIDDEAEHSEKEHERLDGRIEEEAGKRQELFEDHGLTKRDVAEHSKSIDEIRSQGGHVPAWPLLVGGLVGLIAFIATLLTSSSGAPFWDALRNGFGWGAVIAGILYAIVFIASRRKNKTSQPQEHRESETRTEHRPDDRKLSLRQRLGIWFGLAEDPRVESEPFHHQDDTVARETRTRETTHS